MPRPTRRLAFLLPAAGLIVFIRIVSSFPACFSLTYDSFSTRASRLGDPKQVADLGDHAAGLGRVLHFDRMVAPFQTEPAHGVAMIRLLAHQPAHQGDAHRSR